MKVRGQTSLGQTLKPAPRKTLKLDFDEIMTKNDDQRAHPLSERVSFLYSKRLNECKNS